MQIGYTTIISSFKQHGFGNCTSIGVIKAAIEVFEVGSVFTALHGREGIDVTLRDGRQLQISHEEFYHVEKHCGFQLINEGDTLKEQIADYAKLCFAVICKSKEMAEDYDSFEEAMDDINNGASLYDGAKHLGIAHYCVNIPYVHADNYSGVVAHSAKQTVFVSNGYFDDYGQPNKLNSIGEWSRFANKLYRLDGKPKVQIG